MKRILTLSLLLAAVSAQAQQISEEQAAQTAREFFEARGYGGTEVRGYEDTNSGNPAPSRPRTAAPSMLQLAHHAPDAYYIYNKVSREGKDGFVIVAADERMGASILGWSDQGAFDYDHAPCGLRALLSQYEAAGFRAAVPKKTETGGVSPMLTTRWNQNTPYNDLCPTGEEVVQAVKEEEERWGITIPLPSYWTLWGYGGRCPTGCVATAMAQVMNFWKWPRQGSLSATTNGYVKIHTDFYEHTYDWDNMLDTYDWREENYNETQAKAVAQLMADVGVATDTGYLPDASGSLLIHVYEGLLKHFGYSADIRHYVNKKWETPESYYTDLIQDNDMMAVLKGELDAGRPFIATIAGGGHAVVCDGYNADGYFHLNFGWNGDSDGYYLPASKWGDDFAWTPENDFVTGIHPADKELIDNVWYELKDDHAIATHAEGSTPYSGSLTVRQNITARGKQLPVKGMARGMFQNTSIEDITLEGIQQIPAYSFRGCGQLVKASLQGVREIGRNAFEKCGSLRNVDLGDALQTVGEAAFHECERLDGLIRFPATLRTIGRLAFNMAPIGSVSFLGKGFSVGSSAFYPYKVETVVDGLEGAASLAAYAFTDVLIDELRVSPTTVYEEFAVRGKIGKLHIPAAAKDFPYLGVTGVCEYHVDKGHPRYATRMGMLTDPTGTVLYRFPDMELTQNNYGQWCLVPLYNVRVPAFIKKMALGCFGNEVGLLTIPGSVKEIELGIQEAPNLKEVSCLSATPPALTWHTTLFDGFRSKLRVPNGSKDAYLQQEPWSQVFGGGITDDEIATDGQYVYETYPRYGSAMLLGRNIGEAFSGHADIPATMTMGGQTLAVDEISSQVFYGDEAVTHISLPTSIEYVGGDSFVGASRLSGFSVASGHPTLSVQDGMLMGTRYDTPLLVSCPPLKPDGTERSEAVVPEGTGWIDYRAFGPTLQRVTLPASRANIDGKAFEQCTSLRQVTSLSTTPPYCDGWPFRLETLRNATLLVPVGSLSAYKNAYEWRDFMHIYEIGNIPTNIQYDEESLAGSHLGGIYDLQGRRIAADAARRLPKGIYIVDGKKIIK